MTTARMIELVVAVLILGASFWFYRRPKGADGYGSQGAVILLVIGAIMGAHALGAMDYHPSKGELEAMKERSR